MRLVLLPGLDGTSKLYAPLLGALPEDVDATAVAYPSDRFLTYAELEQLLRGACPDTEPFTLFAESFSTPLVVQYAATAPSNLRGVIMCAGFSSTPVRGWLRALGWLFAPVLVRLPLTGFAVRALLLGRGAPTDLVDELREVISSVRPSVLADRVRATLKCDMRLALEHVTAPVLYIEPQNDRVISADCVREVQKCNSKVNVIRVKGPHLIAQREPRKTAEIIVSFLRSLEV